jgi:hypothetical protein
MKLKHAPRVKKKIERAADFSSKVTVHGWDVLEKSNIIFTRTSTL